MSRYYGLTLQPMSRLPNRHLLLFQTKFPANLSTSARQLFDEIPNRTIPFTDPSNTATTGRSQLYPWFSFTTALRLIGACVQESDISTGRPLHCLATKSGLSLNPFVGSCLVDLYSKCGLVEDARSVFDDVSVKDSVLWNVMVSCYSLNGLAVEAFRAFESMRSEGFCGDGFTFSSLLSSCSSSGWGSLGQQIHALLIKLVSDSDTIASSALVDAYAKCRLVEDARRAFDLMGCRNVVSWNSIIVGYGHHGEGKKAMKLFTRMIWGGPKPDELTLASVISSCADSAGTSEAVQVHAFVWKTGFGDFVSVGNALIIAYSRGGCIESAFECFRSIPQPDSVTWNSMVSSFAFHGLAARAVEAFDGMVATGVKPNGIAFLGVLSACSHAGLVEKGLQYFASMSKDYQIEPNSEHYTCLVDLLGRANHLHEAYNVIKNMQIEPNGDVLAAFAGACSVHGNTELAKRAAERLLSARPDELPNYKAMANAYAALGRWEDVARVRRMMRDACGRTHPGCSWIEIGDTVHAFVSTDKSHPRASELYFVLKLLVKMME